MAAEQDDDEDVLCEIAMVAAVVAVTANSLTLKNENAARCGRDQCFKGVPNLARTIC